MVKWKRVAENIVRRSGGTYYLSAKVGGRKIRRSLKTDDLRTAKLRRDDQLRMLRSEAVGEPVDVRTLGDALSLVATRIEEMPGHRPRTKDFYREVVKNVRKTLPLGLHGSAWTRDAAAGWWAKYSAGRSAEQANKGLSVVRKVAGVLVEAGLRSDDPTKNLRRMRVPQTAVEDLPSVEEVEAVVREIRAQRKRVSEEAANMVEFLARSGLRIGELRILTWEDVGDEWLTIREGKTGRRRVPISPALRAVIERIRYPGAAGPVFHLRSPRYALSNACRRLGVPHLRLHDLRHIFATTAMERGVDVPTLAKWLGHKDGGALAMRTYGHIRDEHSLESIRKMD